MTTFTVSEFIYFITTPVSEENKINLHKEDDYKADLAGGYASKSFHYTDNRWISYTENFSYKIDDGDSPIETSDLEGDAEFRFTWNWDFTVEGVDEDGDIYALSDSEIEEIIEAELNLNIDYSVLEQFTLGSEVIA